MDERDYKAIYINGIAILTKQIKPYKKHERTRILKNRKRNGYLNS